MIFNFSIIVWLFPIIFMLHEFEEIIFFKYWINKNKNFLFNKYPKISKRFLSHFENLSTPAFTVAVAEEFILLSIITIASVIFDMYLLWLGIFMGFFIHLFTHLIQWIIIRRYIPAIYTTFISFAYCIFSLNYMVNNNIFQIKDILLWTIIGLAIVFTNLIIAHKLAFWFDKITKK
ncbi:HXXEE domain-containing protein [Dysgonomonas sp. Marseille-P4677]|uniref:HXXEE domain-containing protein n=1 Tax=Dysgonomonas sp. Marseille-P4677 TaxID=2364790 RepID=UPI001914390E